MRDRIPPALPRAPPSFGACGGARTHTRTGPQHRSRPGYAGAWQRPGRQAARACHARSHPTSSTARATVLWRVWWRAHPHPYQPQHRSRQDYTGAWQRPDRQAARARHARSHPAGPTARATVLYSVRETTERFYTDFLLHLQKRSEDHPDREHCTADQDTPPARRRQYSNVHDTPGRDQHTNSLQTLLKNSRHRYVVDSRSALSRCLRQRREVPPDFGVSPVACRPGSGFPGLSWIPCETSLLHRTRRHGVCRLLLASVALV